MIESILAAKKSYAAAEQAHKDAQSAVHDLRVKKNKIAQQIQTLEQHKVTIDKQTNSSHRISDVLSAIRATLEQRRKQLDAKRNSQESLAFPDHPPPELAVALKTSFRQKMEHRRLVIVLRPSRQSMLDELQTLVAETNRDKPNAKVDENEAFLRAEQLLLLALHPAAPEEGLAPIPPRSGSGTWGEPGWHITLNIDSQKPSSSLLPTLDVSSTFRMCQSSCNSAPGRQSSLLLRACFLRMLTAPLSKISEASAPAEPPKNVAFDDGKCTGYTE